MQTKNRFQRTWAGKVTFRCATCGRNTRLAGQDSDALCAQCYELAGLENTVSDCGWEDQIATERDALVAQAVKLGTEEARLRASFPSLWPKQS